MGSGTWTETSYSNSNDLGKRIEVKEKKREDHIGEGKGET